MLARWTKVSVRWLRWILGVQIALLLAQFELGEWFSIFGNIPASRMSGVSLATVEYNLVVTGPALIAHAVLGVVVFSTAVAIFLLSFPVRIRWLRIATGLALFSVAGAGLGGFLFVGQGFAGDRSLFLMSTGFISVFAFTGVSLHLMSTSRGSLPAEKGAPAPKP